MVLVLGYGASSSPMTYLSVSLGCNMSRITNWKGVVDKFKSKLSAWKAHTLSIGGRLTMIKSVLGDLLTYYMSLYRMSVAVEKTLESMHNNVFIGGDSEDQKITWVAWKKNA